MLLAPGLTDSDPFTLTPFSDEISTSVIELFTPWVILNELHFPKTASINTSWNDAFLDDRQSIFIFDTVIDSYIENFGCNILSR